MTGCQYRDQTAILEYLLPVNLPIVRARLDRIVNVIATAQEWFAQQPAGSIDGLVLSNIGELMSQEERAADSSQHFCLQPHRRNVTSSSGKVLCWIAAFSSPSRGRGLKMRDSWPFPEQKRHFR